MESKLPEANLLIQLNNASDSDDEDDLVAWVSFAGTLSVSTASPSLVLSVLSFDIMPHTVVYTPMWRDFQRDILNF